MLLSTKIVISSRSIGLSAVAASIMGPYITQAARVRIVRPEAQTLSLATDLLDFFHDHRRHGLLTADATEPAEKGPARAE